MSRSPAEVPDDVFVALRTHFNERQIVDLTMTIAVENLLSRFNRGLDVGAQGFTEGASCLLPEHRPD